MSKRVASTESRRSRPIQMDLGGETVSVDLSNPIDLSIPLSFSGEDPSLYGIGHATKAAFSSEGVSGDTRKGGSCNFDSLHLVPHCQGTHTECIGHITHERIAIHDVLPGGLIPCTLISISPSKLADSNDSSRPRIQTGDMGLTAKDLKTKLDGIKDHWLEAVIIRTQPNEEQKRSANYTSNEVPFLTIQAIDYLVQRGVTHLLTDLPSVDRLHDDGEMAAHRTWWDLAPGSHVGGSDISKRRTISELLFVPNELPDGRGLVSIHVPPFMSDAAPSRPFFFPASV